MMETVHKHPTHSKLKHVFFVFKGESPVRANQQTQTTAAWRTPRTCVSSLSHSGVPPLGGKHYSFTERTTSTPTTQTDSRWRSGDGERGQIPGSSHSSVQQRGEAGQCGPNTTYQPPSLGALTPQTRPMDDSANRPWSSRPGWFDSI